MEVADASRHDEHDHCETTHDSNHVFECADDDGMHNVIGEVGIGFANGSGSVAHVLSPDDIPSDVMAVKLPDGKCRNFI